MRDSETNKFKIDNRHIAMFFSSSVFLNCVSKIEWGLLNELCGKSNFIKNYFNNWPNKVFIYSISIVKIDNIFTVYRHFDDVNMNLKKCFEVLVKTDFASTTCFKKMHIFIINIFYTGCFSTPPQYLWGMSSNPNKKSMGTFPKSDVFRKRVFERLG